MTAEPRDSREFLRHTVATLAYRAGKAVRGAPPEFAGFKAGPTSRTPAEVSVLGENYARADIELGRVGQEQPPANSEFD